MPRALNSLRPSQHYEREAFDAGLSAVGYDVVQNLPGPTSGDVLLIWNRYGAWAEQAIQFERFGGRVLVAENGYLGKQWRGGKWFSLAVGHHNGAGTSPYRGPARWDGWGVELSPWRSGAGSLILGQRGIGEVGLRSPDGWAEATQARYGGHIRQHPGTGAAALLEDELRGVARVLTWNSGAAVLALAFGVPVWYAAPEWIGAGAARTLSGWPGQDLRDDATRLDTFRRMAWAVWNLEEVRTGEAIESILGGRA